MATRAELPFEDAPKCLLDVRAEGVCCGRHGQTQDNPDDTKGMTIQIGACSVRGLRARLEDTAFASLHCGLGAANGSQIGLAGVFDGVGGNRGGDRASACAARAASSYLSAWVSDRLGLPIRPAQLATTIQESLREASDAVWVEGMVDPGLDGAATTAVIAVVHGWRVTIGAAGDSRAYRIGRGGAARLTGDHTKAKALFDSGKIPLAALRDHPEASVLTRWLGGPHPPVVDTRSVELQPGDAVVLVTDGVHGMLEDHLIASITTGVTGAQEAADELVGRALRWGTSDNATAVVCRIGRSDTCTRGAAADRGSFQQEIKV